MEIGEDRISELPDCILIYILSSLPLKSAMVTATLSRRWRFLWKEVPNLAFSKFDPYPSKTNLVSFIDKALLLRNRSPIKRFSVESSFYPKYQSTVDVWLHVATESNVEAIELLFLADGHCRYTLPQHMYTNSSLVRLSLRSCVLRPNREVSWPSLKRLCISNDDDKLNDDLIEIVLSGCPALESLQLRRCGGISKLNIRSASLKKLVVSRMKLVEISAFKVESLSILGSLYGDIILDLPSVVTATLDFEFRRERDGSKASYARSRRLVTYLFETLGHLQNLTIGKWLIQVLSVMEVQKLTSPVFTGKHLKLNTKFMMWSVPGIANLLRQSVSLETLVMNMVEGDTRYQLVSPEEDECRKMFDEYHEKVDHEKYWNPPEGGLVNSLQHRKTVITIETAGDTEVMAYTFVLELLKFVVKNARVLEKLKKVTICPKPSCCVIIDPSNPPERLC